MWLLADEVYTPSCLCAMIHALCFDNMTAMLLSLFWLVRIIKCNKYDTVGALLYLLCMAIIGLFKAMGSFDICYCYLLD